MGFKNILTIPPFHSNYSHSSSSEITPNLPFVLYHGNLNVPENNIAVRFLLQHIFTNKNIKYVIAGSCNNIKLREKILQHPNIKLIPNPDSQQIEELLRSANVIVLPTFQNTGIKLKLIESLYKGNHIITNEQMVDGFPLPQLVKIAKSNDQFHRLIREALSHPLEDEKRAERVKMLDIFFSNEDNAQKMIEAFYNLSR
ncbi:MAG: glycosyltransferase [Bacteroidota bacterium]